jgi:hypothetical protein
MATVTKTEAPVMENRARRFSPAIFGIALIMFFLPWINVSCGGERFATFTGIQLVTGTTITNPIENRTERVNGEPLAIFALLVVIMGFGLSFLKGKNGIIGSAIVGGVGAIILLLLKYKLDNEILKEGGGTLQLGYGVGFYSTLVFFLSAIGVNLYFIMPNKEKL